ncbi:hypothetical protein ACFQ61_32490 [Streptomyces sp. NPDC056500]|uniref:DUF7507 domain-containing protein n=1 Tax=Streptomyces sp. NPDC056500 TaxID=3345840 RepID=UPI0036C05294
MSYRIAFAPAAAEALGKLASPSSFKAAVTRTLGANTYGHGSTPVGGDRDRREAVVSWVFVRCMVSPTLVRAAAETSFSADGETLHYTYTVTNTAQTPLSNITVTDNGPGTPTVTCPQNTPAPGTSQVCTATVDPASFTDDLSGLLDDAEFNDDAEASIGTVSYTEPTLTWEDTPTPGQSATITFSISVNNPTTGDRKLTNTVVSDTPGSNCATCSTDPRCTSEGQQAHTQAQAAVSHQVLKLGKYTYSKRTTHHGWPTPVLRGQ